MKPKHSLNHNIKSVPLVLTGNSGSGTFGLGVESEANLAVVVNTTNLQNMTSVTVSGAGTASINASAITTADAKLTTINLSGMTALANQNALGQEVGSGPTLDTGTVGGYFNLSTSTVTLSTNTAETVLLGGAKDTVVTGSTIVKMDTITGFQVVADAANPLVADAARSDVLDIAGQHAGLFSSAIALGTAGHAAKMTVTGSTLEAALLQAAGLKGADGTTNVENVVFHFGGNTYVYSDVGADGLSDGDALVRMTGTLNLDLLLTSNTIV